MKALVHWVQPRTEGVGGTRVGARTAMQKGRPPGLPFLLSTDCALHPQSRARTAFSTLSLAVYRPHGSEPPPPRPGHRHGWDRGLPPRRPLAQRGGPGYGRSREGPVPVSLKDAQDKRQDQSAPSGGSAEERARGVHGVPHWLYSPVVPSVVHGFGRHPDPRSGDVHEFRQRSGTCQGSIGVLLVKGPGHAADVQGRAVRGDPA